MTYKEPKPFQWEGAQFLQGAVQGAILADEPGLGKTLQAALAWRMAQGPILVVTTMRNKIFWAMTILEQVTLDENIVIAETAGRFDAQDFKNQRGRRWLITHWQAIARKGANTLLDIPWWGVIVDEAHHLKDRNTKQSTFLTHTLRSPRWIYLTANPQEKSAVDMWPMLHRCNTEKYASFWSFYHKWADIKTMWVSPGSGGRKPIEVVVGTKNPEAFAAEIRPYILQRTKAQVAPQLPPVETETVPLPLNGLTSHYEKFEKETIIELQNMPKTPYNLYISNALARRVRLQQLISNPATFGIKIQSPKAEWLYDFIVDTGDHPVLVFCKFRDTTAMLELMLPCKTLRVVGGSEKWRGWPKDVKCVVCTYGTLQESVNLDKTDDGRPVHLVVKYDLQDSTIVDEQSTDRVHRLTTTEQVTEYLLRCSNTVDDDILEGLEHKFSAIEAVEYFLKKRRAS